ncbi:MAG: YaiI/YqxD family protein [Pseudoxanthomonas sp.]|uniref:YaiI/YqxD family protein n=1 Tax=Pseudoxanthomonas sp. TaxID=1871049 RepID=UPI0028C5011E|nr:YaiI/YqxD family protein [Pseudoxanthomonas sp.]MCR6627392.1 YaiI/YqxD family protein [Pseudoxanthomonas sp.]
MSNGGAPAAQVWVDADACPAPVKEILFRAAERARVQVTLVANQWLCTPPSRFIRALQVQGGYDVADDAIVERAQAGDLVVTQDIPLAARVLANGAQAINPRGDRFTQDNIAERLSIRNFMDELRGAGVQTGGPAAFNARDRQAFANQLDRWLATRR